MTQPVKSHYEELKTSSTDSRTAVRLLRNSLRKKFGSPDEFKSIEDLTEEAHLAVLLINELIRRKKQQLVDHSTPPQMLKPRKFKKKSQSAQCLRKRHCINPTEFKKSRLTKTQSCFDYRGRERKRCIKIPSVIQQRSVTSAPPCRLCDGYDSRIPKVPVMSIDLSKSPIARKRYKTNSPYVLKYCRSRSKNAIDELAQFKSCISIEDEQRSILTWGKEKAQSMFAVVGSAKNKFFNFFKSTPTVQ